MDKLIFLDIGGVLNSDDFWENRFDITVEPPHGNIDILAFRRLNNIVKRTGAKVVISSSWRKTYTYSELEELFSDLEFRGELVGVTSILGEKFECRGIEVKTWVKTYNKPCTYIVLDNHAEMFDGFGDNFYLIDGVYGLTDGDVEHIVNFLNK